MFGRLGFEGLAGRFKGSKSDSHIHIICLQVDHGQPCR